MAVLLSYHKMVERDAKHVDIQWKGKMGLEAACHQNNRLFLIQQSLQ